MSWMLNCYFSCIPKPQKYCAIENLTNKNNHLKYELSENRESHSWHYSFVLFHSNLWIFEARGGFDTHFLFLLFIANLINSRQKKRKERNRRMLNRHMEASSFNFFFFHRLWNFDWRHEAYNTTKIMRFLLYAERMAQITVMNDDEYPAWTEFNETTLTDYIEMNREKKRWNRWTKRKKNQVEKKLEILYCAPLYGYPVQ